MGKITKEKAIKIIKDNKDNDAFDPSHYNTIINDTLHQYYLDHFKEFRDYSDDLKDDIPEPDVSPDHPDYRILKLDIKNKHPLYPKLKGRGNVIVGIGSWFQGSINDEIIKDENIIKKIQEYRNKHWEFEKGKKKGEYWTTPEEIEYINNTLDIVINYIEDTYFKND